MSCTVLTSYPDYPGVCKGWGVDVSYRTQVYGRSDRNHHCTKERQGERRRKEKQGIRLMEEILHQRICSLSHYLQYFIDSRWCRISSINSMKRIDMEKIKQEAREVKRIQSRSRPKTAHRWTYWKVEVNDNDENKFQKLNKNKQTRITTRTTIAIMNNIIIVYNEVQKR